MDHGEGEKFLSKAEKAADAMLAKFDARVEAVFEILDYDHSGELSMEKMERCFGAETHEFWEDMDGEISVMRLRRLGPGFAGIANGSVMMT